MDESQLRYNVEQIVTDQIKMLREDIIANHFAAGQKASGRTAQSMTINVTNESGVVVGTLDGRAYVGNLEQGNQPFRAQYFRRRADGSTYPSAPKWFIDIIAEWASDKGIDLDSPWGVASSIMVNGTALFRDGGRADIFTPEIPKAVNEIQRRLAGLFDAQLTASVFDTLRKNEEQ